jgi:hypothetical protein
MEKLLFIHIPKTAGTTIQNTIEKCDNFIVRPQTTELHYLKMNGSVNWYHYPLIMYSDLGKEYLKKFKLFTVVRNPYSRIVSLYNCQWFNIEQTYNQDTEKQFNEKIIKFIDIDRKNESYKYKKQYLYTHLNDIKFVDHILKFENLKNDFDDLMKLYNINLTIKEHSNKKKGLLYTEDNLYDNTKSLIYEYYIEDFKNFEYKK